MHDVHIDLATASNVIVMVVNIGLLMANLAVLQALNALAIATTGQLPLKRLPRLLGGTPPDTVKPKVVAQSESKIVRQEQKMKSELSMQRADELGKYE